MKKCIKNCSGLTLVEILAVVVLLSIVMIIVLNILNTSSNQNKEQTAEAFQINDAAYTLKQITKDIRKTYRIDSIANSYTLTGKNNVINYVYDSTAKTLARDNVVIINNIDNFEINPNSNGYTISFRINNQEYSTKLALRTGDF